MYRKNMARLNIKEFAKYLGEVNVQMDPLKICESYKVSLDVYYRWKSIFNRLSEDEIEKIFNTANC